VCASNVYTKTQSHVRGCAPYMFAASETLSLYRYIHTHTYIPIYSHIYMFIHIYIYINIYTYTHIYRYAYICINININFLRALHGMQLVPHTLSHSPGLPQSLSFSHAYTVSSYVNIIHTPDHPYLNVCTARRQQERHYTSMYMYINTYIHIYTYIFISLTHQACHILSLFLIFIYSVSLHSYNAYTQPHVYRCVHDRVANCTTCIQKIMIF